MKRLDVDRLARALHATRTGCYGLYREGYDGSVLHECVCGDHWNGECPNQPHRKAAARIVDAYENGAS